VRCFLSRVTVHITHTASCTSQNISWHLGSSLYYTQHWGNTQCCLSVTVSMTVHLVHLFFNSAQVSQDCTTELYTDAPPIHCLPHSPNLKSAGAFNLLKFALIPKKKKKKKNCMPRVYLPATYPHRVPSANGLHLSSHIFMSRLPAANRRSAWLTTLINCPICPVVF